MEMGLVGGEVTRMRRSRTNAQLKITRKAKIKVEVNIPRQDFSILIHGRHDHGGRVAMFFDP